MSDDELAALVSRHRARGVFVDSNLLLLFLVGSCEVSLIRRFKRTRQYAEEDYEILVDMLRRFDRIVTSPNVATAVSNLGSHLRDDWRESFFRPIS
jgi:hypothetical protein